MSSNTQTIQNLLSDYDSNKIKPSDLIKGYFDRIKKDKHGVFLSVCEHRASKQVKKLEDTLLIEKKVPRERFPLFGVPIAIKDILVVEGVKTTCGSKMLEDYVPPYSATCIDRLERAGAIVVGKLNMDEFAMGSSNENSAFGPVKHPTHPDRVPGGSSGGSAVGVALDLCMASLGTDTGGSIRLPASYCGVVGLKPTYGRVSRYGLVAYASSLDQVGPMARTVEDTARILDVISGYDPLDSTCSQVQSGRYSQSLANPLDLKKIRIGIPKEYFVGGLNPEVESAVRSAIDWYQKQGAQCKPVSLPHTSYALATYYVVAVSEASSNLARFDGIRYGFRPPESDREATNDLKTYYEHARAHFGHEVKRRILLGTFALSSGYYDAYYRRACQVRRLIKTDFDKAFAEVDCIAAPVAPTTAFKLGEKISDPLQMYLVDALTIPVNLAGLPAMSIPCGQDRDRLPIGLQLIGPHFSEERLLGLAHAFERVRGSA